MTIYKFEFFRLSLSVDEEIAALRKRKAELERSYLSLGFLFLRIVSGIIRVNCSLLKIASPRHTPRILATSTP